MMEKGRGRVGNAKLTRENAELIRLLRSQGQRVDVLAERFGVCRASIWNVVVGVTWKPLLVIRDGAA